MNKITFPITRGMTMPLSQIFKLRFKLFSIVSILWRTIRANVASCQRRWLANDLIRLLAARRAN